MTYTSHGHHVKGTIEIGPRPQIVRCGGPGICTICSRESATILKDMDITPKPITVTQAMTNPEKLMMLRTELFNAVQKLEGDELAEFWKIMDDLNSMRQSVVSGNQDLDIDSNTRMISITAPRMGDVVFLVSYGERFAYQKIDRSFFQDAVQAGIMAKVMLEQLDAYMEKMQVEQEAERMEEEGK